ncbi:MAG: metalloregulator ArsR/SmtB family transcription factor [Rothia sp. (in: high G+C Gram-positive bacteria)]|uniref:ArsR/SmtB family transcription factor n=1 Tax=Rothia sp. (in: high G+C Gram-positive bacteria) TaxID=1885016 RepID=UPI0026E0329F|nr:metalloregulator ArsR/SmtB family transcription factor [Rothia sp. (in: high G+C Gram-positive bacteria)]MDO5751157.1 metalloregulator ArsR/SmtB family transcription factor [Rothia sp. (in: high G+C Gram-positive bacteria)]
MQADVFSVIADPTRRRIMHLLAEQTHTVGALVEKLDVSQPTISKHLKILREFDYVSVDIEGQRRLYSLDLKAFEELNEWIAELTHLVLTARQHPEVALPGGVSVPAVAPAQNIRVVNSRATEAAEQAPAASIQQDSSEEDTVLHDSFAVPAAPTVATVGASAPQAAQGEETYGVGIDKASAKAEDESEDDALLAESTPLRPFTPGSYGIDSAASASAEEKSSASSLPAPVAAVPAPVAAVPAAEDKSDESAAAEAPASQSVPAYVTSPKTAAVADNAVVTTQSVSASATSLPEAAIATVAVEPSTEPQSTVEQDQEETKTEEVVTESPEQSAYRPYTSAYTQPAQTEEQRGSGNLFSRLFGGRR